MFGQEILDTFLLNFGCIINFIKKISTKTLSCRLCGCAVAEDIALGKRAIVVCTTKLAIFDIALVEDNGLDLPPDRVKQKLLIKNGAELTCRAVLWTEREDFGAVKF